MKNYIILKRNFYIQIDTIERDLLLEAKQKGYGDQTNCTYVRLFRKSSV